MPKPHRLLLSSRLIHKIGGNFSRNPEELTDSISPGAQKLIQQAFHDISTENLVDYHTHILGLGTEDTGNFVNPDMLSWLHPVKRFKTGVYLSAAGIRELRSADQEYVSRLVRLIRSVHHHGKHRILAFDRHYTPDGRINLKKTEFYISNQYIFGLVQRYPDLFLPVISIHPYRSDAIDELEKWASQGAKYIKWLPNAMGMDPSDTRLDGFYKIMKKYDMILLSHTGIEKAVDAEEDQNLGNPLLLRSPLDHGIRVIMAHCASMGNCIDLESPRQEKVPCFDLFIRLMDEKTYAGLVFGDISATLQINRSLKDFGELLKRADLHPRLVNGSDYPLPAVNVVFHTAKLMKKGFISKEERTFINEIYDYNPLLFDFVLKRTIRHPETGQKLSPSIFMANPLLDK